MKDADEIRAAENFIAADDSEAMEIAAVLLRSTRDIFSRAEVWCGSRFVSGSGLRPSDQELCLETMREERQARTIALEERLKSSFDCINQSRILIDATTQRLAENPELSTRVRALNVEEES
jgi:hypothetical protein